jgi:nucleoside-diphosphate-sugar epimerase
LLYTNEYLKPGPFVYGDVTDYARLKSILSEVDCVVWLAAIVGDAACMVNPRKAIATNQEAVQFLAENFDGPIIFPSSCSVYGINEGVATEASELAPLSLYAQTKIQAEKYLVGKKALVLRLGTLHGVSERMRFDLVVNVMTMNAHVRGNIEVFGGKQYRPLLSVKDVAEFIVSMVDQDWTPGVYNLATENLTVLEVARIVEQEISNVSIEIVKTEFEDRRNYRVDFSKASDLLGFKGRYTTRNSVRELSQLVGSGRIKDFSDLKYANLATLNGLKQKSVQWQTASV